MDFIRQIMINLFNMSLSASFVVLAVLLLRVLLKKAPKIYSYLLWIIVLIRFLCPVTIRSALSLIPLKHKTLSYTNGEYRYLSLNTGFQRFDSAVTYRINDYGKLYASGEHSTADILISVLCMLWLIGILALFVWYIISYINLKLRLRTATIANVESNCPVYETDQIQGPFLLGLIRPRIYLPVGMDESDLKYVLDHERMHIRRKDNLVKPICFLAVMIHWFNPLAWLSMHLMIKDMELSCDEEVLKKTGEDIRTQYSTALLNVSMKQSGLLLPIAFGETNTKNRIMNILNFRRPTIWIGVAGVIILVVASITLLTSNTMADGKTEQTKISKSDSAVDNLSNKKKNENELLVENRNPYIGNHVKDYNLIGILPAPEGLAYDHFELQTKKEPYELTVYYNIIGSTSSKTREMEVTNAILLFSTIQNMGICSFKTLNESSLDMTFYRSEMEKVFGQLYQNSSDTESMKDLKKKMTEYITSYRLDQSITNANMDPQ